MTGRHCYADMATDDARIMMALLESLLEWANDREALLIAMAVLSAAVFVLSLASVPWLVSRIPTDYFDTSRRPTLPWAEHHPLVRWPLLVLKNLTGLVFLAAGIAMLVLPGQGLLTMLAGLVLMNFPGKYRLERWLIRQPAVLGTVNWLRRRRGREPLRL